MRYFSVVMFSIFILSTVACSGDSDGGLIDCTSFIDRLFECEVLPPENKDQLRDPNIQICNAWEKTYKTEVMTALADCIPVACEELYQCTYEANALCQADVSESITRLCEKISECGWEEMTTQQACEDEMVYNSGLYMCLKPEVLSAYIDCVRAIECGSDSEDEWYLCGSKHVQNP